MGPEAMFRDTLAGAVDGYEQRRREGEARRAALLKTVEDRLSAVRTALEEISDDIRQGRDDGLRRALGVEGLDEPSLDLRFPREVSDEGSIVVSLHSESGPKLHVEVLVEREGARGPRILRTHVELEASDWTTVQRHPAERGNDMRATLLSVVAEALAFRATELGETLEGQGRTLDMAREQAAEWERWEEKARKSRRPGRSYAEAAHAVLLGLPGLPPVHPPKAGEWDTVSGWMVRLGNDLALGLHVRRRPEGVKVWPVVTDAWGAEEWFRGDPLPHPSSRNFGEAVAFALALGIAARDEPDDWDWQQE